MTAIKFDHATITLANGDVLECRDATLISRARAEPSPKIEVVLGDLTADVYRLLESARANSPLGLEILRYVHERICLARFQIKGAPFNRELPPRPNFARAPKRKTA